MNKKVYFSHLLMPCLFLFAFLLKLTYVHFSAHPIVMSSDAQLYSNMAENFLHGNGLVNTIRDRDYVVGPVFPLLTALIYFLFGTSNYMAMLLLQIALSAVNSLIFYRLGNRLWGKNYGWLPYTLFLLYPPFTFWNTWLITETTYIFVTSLMLYGFVSYMQVPDSDEVLIEYVGNKKIFIKRLLNRPFLRNKRARWAAFIGIALGLGNLIKPLFLFFFPFLALWFCHIQQWKWRSVIRDSAIAALMIVSVMSPWWLRNYARYHEFIAVSNYGAQEFYAGNNPYTITNEPFSLDLPTYDQTALAGILKLPILEQERAFKQKALAYILDHPLQFMKRTAEKASNLFWAPLKSWEGQVYSMNLWQLDRYYLFLGLSGALIGIFQHRMVIFIITSAYYSIVVCTITVVSGGRYRAPVMTVAILFCSLAVIQLLKILVLIRYALKSRVVNRLGPADRACKSQES